LSQPNSVHFSLPLPPSINHQYVTAKNGRRRLSPHSKKWKQDAMRELEVLRFEGRIPEPFLKVASEGYLSLFLDFYFETPLRRDLDGGLKILQDTICEVLGLNDNRVVDIHLIKRMDPLRPRVEVQLEALPDWQFDDEYIYLGPTDSQ
jgi:crossover junction endodeoxyribonuclease RusA